ncbi:hypothetical protein MPLA_680053 [Mesorhizobium sp. ORS 3359]|nr:hypothetical protein MPLA_680053 [Mesorhizobium sp. ORS 3359]
MKLLLGCRFCDLQDLEPPIENWAVKMAGYKYVSIREPGRDSPIERGTGGGAVFDPVLHRWASAPVSLKIRSYSCMEFMRSHKVQSGRAKCDPSETWMNIIQAINFQ